MRGILFTFYVTLISSILLPPLNCELVLPLAFAFCMGSLLPLNNASGVAQDTICPAVTQCFGEPEDVYRMHEAAAAPQELEVPELSHQIMLPAD